jgi:uroporphyrin-III C-methyltransferase
MKQRGKVILAGAGPGDPELITVKAAKALGRAQAVVYDRLVDPALLKLAPKSALRLDMGKRPGGKGASQPAINRLLVSLARKGLRVVRLKGGDPFTFARGGEEALALARAKVEFEVIPGVTASLAALAEARVPLTHRGLADCAVLAAGRVDSGAPLPKREALLAGMGATLIYYMAVGQAGLLAARLMKAGLDPRCPALVVERGTWPGQRILVTRLSRLGADMQGEKVQAPALLAIGKVVGLRRRLAPPPLNSTRGRKIDAI